jgi:hypothetical protein
MLRSLFQRSRPESRELIRWYPASVLVIFALLLCIGVGCSKHQDSTSKAGATPADSLAFSKAKSVEDEALRLDALQQFVDAHPGSPLSGTAYPEIVSLAAKVRPETLTDILKRFSATDFKSSDPYNAIGWDLAESGEHLDLAVPILVKAVAKARALGDSTNLASCLDSEAWARYKAADARAAVAPMEEARRLTRLPDDEMERHMSLIYDAAGMPEKAQPIYVSLLSHMEDPDLRARLEKGLQATGGSPETVNAEIDRGRAASITPAPEFTLPSLVGGKPISLSEYRGKVVLLNFWHYT